MSMKAPSTTMGIIQSYSKKQSLGAALCVIRYAQLSTDVLSSPPALGVPVALRWAARHLARVTQHPLHTHNQCNSAQPKEASTACWCHETRGWAHCFIATHGRESLTRQVLDRALESEQAPQQHRGSANDILGASQSACSRRKNLSV